MPQLLVNKQYADPIAPNASQFDAAFDSIETLFNVIGLGGDNIADDSVGTGKLADSAVTETKIAGSAVTTTEIADASVSKAKLTAAALYLLLEPTGTIDAFGGDTIPAGYLLCDGSAVDRLVYADLFLVTGIRFGNGNGTTTFNVPDLRGRFLRGNDLSSGRDLEAGSRTAMNTGGATGAQAGSVQVDDWKFSEARLATQHNNSLIILPGEATNGNRLGTGDIFLPLTGTSYGNAYGGSLASQPLKRPSNEIGPETRPVNVNVHWVIKT